MKSAFLTPTEDKLFAELDTVAGRFTDIEEDLIKYSGAYFSEPELKSKVMDVKKNYKKMVTGKAIQLLYKKEMR
ncbi:hypothetical protein JST99_01165 [Candidatus Dependentiae bacterium]|nr:hypothetical protein [Candidatus Dependentiae bacterium]